MMDTKLYSKDVKKKTGQVMIQVRDVYLSSGGKSQDDNPFDFDLVCKNIENALKVETEKTMKIYIRSHKPMPAPGSPLGRSATLTTVEYHQTSLD